MRTHDDLLGLLCCLFTSNTSSLNLSLAQQYQKFRYFHRNFMAKVSLDALISREDFEVEDNSSPGKKKETISIEDIKADSFFFLNVRKPDCKDSGRGT